MDDRVEGCGEDHEALVAELRASRALIDAVLAHSSDLVIFFHGDGTIDWVSPPVEALFGVEAAALLGTNGFEAIHPDDRARVLEDFLTIPDLGDSVLTEFRISIGDEVRWVEEIATNLLEEPNVGRIVGNLRDVTERKLAQEALLFQGTLLAAAGQAIVALDTRGTVLYWNDAAEDLYGWSAEDAIGRPLTDLVPLAERSDRPPAASATAGGASWDGEVEVVARSGRTIPIRVTSRPVTNAAGELVATTVVSFDTTEQRRHQEEAARLSAIVESSNDAIFSADPDGTIATWNGGAARLYGRSADAALGTHLSTLATDAEADRLVAAFERILHDGGPEELITEGCDAEGHPFDMALSMSPIRTATGAFVGVSTIARDISERVQQRQRDEDARRRLADAQASARLGSFELDLATGEMTRSDELYRILGVPPGSFGGVTFEAIHPEDRQAVEEAFAAAASGERDVSCTHRIVRPDGTIRWVLSRTSPTPVSGRAVLAGTMLDITERHEAELALAHQANHDPLTGLANRRLLVEALEASLDRSAATGLRTGVVFVDLDDFKVINDRFGHVDGDEVLRAVGELFDGVTGHHDTVARLGGDEYVVCCDRVADVPELLTRVSRLHDALRRPFRVGSHLHTLTASVGVAVSSPGVQAEALIRNADAAMYAAKQAGGARSELFDDGLYADLRRRQELSAEITSALDGGQFRTHFQPEVDLRTGELVGFEALARWHHPDRGPISPGEFIEIAESSGAIAQLGRQVLADGCRALATWRAASPHQCLSVAINVSPLQLADPNFPADVHDAIQRAGVPADRLCLEVTESSLMDTDVAAEALRNLKVIGVRIAIDDFGTGYSSLSRLKRYPVDLLKIDRSFVAGLGADPEDEVIVATVITLARSLGIHVIAEGVETPEQRDLLAAYGCELGQGFLWSPALAPAEAAAFAARSEQLRRVAVASEPDRRS